MAANTTRKNPTVCPHCHQPAYSGMVGGRCWLCTTHRLSDTSLLTVQVQLQHRYEVEGVTR